MPRYAANEDKFGVTSQADSDAISDGLPAPERKPAPARRRRQAGNVNALMLGSAFVIVSLWLMFDNSKNQLQLTDESVAAASAQEHLAKTGPWRSLANEVDELVVTAPRVRPKSVSFDEPEDTVTPETPQAPQAFWQSPS